MEQQKIDKIIKDVKELADRYSSGISESAKVALTAIKDIVETTLEKE